ncbi:glycine zipper 2TM domain-containing protein [Chitinolyticbacter meiyuanensis]|uniref:glycine zipper 2TM domain-containing protein n=1 Tax=Chitinolyticbacter meiyuanensis TaxID=682798 RepID=UPI0011E5C578|nr:glycine zipper 2TM domain-containing protein [Chitinolyticbacter meiyuanensis]
MTHLASRLACLAAVTLLASGCASMSETQRNTAIGATAGGVLGSILTDGSVLGTVGGAAVGGVIGHETTQPSKKKR